MVFVGGDFVVTVRHGDHTGLAGLRRPSKRNISSWRWVRMR